LGLFCVLFFLVLCFEYGEDKFGGYEQMIRIRIVDIAMGCLYGAGDPVYAGDA